MWFRTLGWWLMNNWAKSYYLQRVPDDEDEFWKNLVRYEFRSMALNHYSDEFLSHDKTTQKYHYCLQFIGDFTLNFLRWSMNKWECSLFLTFPVSNETKNIKKRLNYIQIHDRESTLFNSFQFFWFQFFLFFKSFQIFSNRFKSFQIFSNLFKSVQIFSNLLNSFKFLSILA